MRPGLKKNSATPVGGNLHGIDPVELKNSAILRREIYKHHAAVEDRRYVKGGALVQEIPSLHRETVGDGTALW